MRKLFLATAAVGLFTAATAPQAVADDHLPRPRICSTHYYIVEPVKLMPVLLKHYKELGLTEEQKKAIKELIRTIKERIIPLDRAIDRLSERVRKDMLKEEDRIVVEGEMRVLANLKVERSLYNYLCIRSLKKILTEEQFKKLLSLAGYDIDDD